MTSSSASYHRTHLRTALSDTPYLRPTADQFVSAISRMSCSYGGRSTVRAATARNRCGSVRLPPVGRLERFTTYEALAAE